MTKKTRVAYHATPTRNVSSIKKIGLSAGFGGFGLSQIHIAYSRKTVERYARDLKGRGEKNVSIITVRVPYGLELVRPGFLPPFALIHYISPQDIVKVEKLF